MGCKNREKRLEKVLSGDEIGEEKWQGNVGVE
jgi:hypothetical protein